MEQTFYYRCGPATTRKIFCGNRLEQHPFFCKESMMRDQGRALVRIIIAGLVVACAPATVPAQQTGQPGGAPGGARPCDLAAYRQFDFWVGEWEVRAQGRT